MCICSLGPTEREPWRDLGSAEIANSDSEENRNNLQDLFQAALHHRLNTSTVTKFIRNRKSPRTMNFPYFQDSPSPIRNYHHNTGSFSKSLNTSRYTLIFLKYGTSVSDITLTQILSTDSVWKSDGYLTRSLRTEPIRFSSPNVSTSFGEFRGRRCAYQRIGSRRPQM